MLLAKPFIMRLGTGMFKPRNPILGTEFAGQVEAVGAEVKSFQVGDRVFGFDDGGLSTYAEYLTISESKGLDTIPEELGYQQAAASIEGAHYAYNFINKVDLRAGTQCAY